VIEQTQRGGRPPANKGCHSFAKSLPQRGERLSSPFRGDEHVPVDCDAASPIVRPVNLNESGWSGQLATRAMPSHLVGNVPDRHPIPAVKLSPDGEVGLALPERHQLRCSLTLGSSEKGERIANAQLKERNRNAVSTEAIGQLTLCDAPLQSSFGFVLQGAPIFLLNRSLPPSPVR